MNEQELKIINLIRAAGPETQKILSDPKLQNEIIAIEKNYKLSEKESYLIQEKTIEYLLFPEKSRSQLVEEITIGLRSRGQVEIDQIIKQLGKNILKYKNL
jgi:hypothetical protein